MRSLRSLIGDYARLVARPAAFAGVGVINTAVDMAAFALLVGLAGFPPLPANVISFSLGALNSFLMNSLVTFRDRVDGRWAAQRLLRFIAVTLVSLLLSSAVLAAALLVLGPIAAKVVSVVVVFAAAYLLNATYVFRASH